MSRSRSSSSGGSIVSDGDGSDPTEGGQVQVSKTRLDHDAVDVDDVDEAVGKETNGVVRPKRRHQADNDASWSGS
jgi:hypothetical protein